METRNESDRTNIALQMRRRGHDGDYIRQHCCETMHTVHFSAMNGTDHTHTKRRWAMHIVHFSAINGTDHTHTRRHWAKKKKSVGAYSREICSGAIHMVRMVSRIQAHRTGVVFNSLLHASSLQECQGQNYNSNYAHTQESQRPIDP